MNKNLKIKNIVQNRSLSDEAKTAQIVTLLNNAAASVVDDLFNSLSAKGLLADKEKAKAEKDVLLGQSTLDDYPQL